MRQRRVQMVGFYAMVLLLAVAPMLTACSGVQAHANAAPTGTKSSPSSAPAFPVANPGGSMDAAAQRKAKAWLAGVVVPGAAVKSSTQPPGVANGPGPELWCQPMGHAVGYWTLPSVSADDTVSWLRSHPSQGMAVTAGSDNAQSGGARIEGGTVVDQPSLGFLEALIFTVTPSGSGSGIRADAFTKAADSVCATPPPGTSLGIGG